MGSTYLKELLSLDDDNENSSMQLYSYISTANDTRAGIRSSFLDGLSIATRSKSIRDFLSHDDLSINDLKGDRQSLIYIIVPDETSIYNEITAVLCGQLINYYIRIAEQDFEGKLPIRVNFLLEELGNIGAAIPDLDHLLSASRSRNIRCQLVLQSLTQLNSLVGQNKAATILGNCDVRMSFRVCNYDTLNELSRMCGEREVIRDGNAIKELLITPCQLAAMETGQALVTISGKLKFITWLPDYTSMNISKVENRPAKRIIRKHPQKTSYFDVQEYVKKRKMEASHRNMTKRNALPYGMSIPNGIESALSDGPGRMDRDIDVDDLIARIDEKIAELESDEDKANNKRDDKGIKPRENRDKIEKRNKEYEFNEERYKDISIETTDMYSVIIITCCQPRKTAITIKNVCGMTEKQVNSIMERLREGTYTIKYLSRDMATELVERLKKIGTIAHIIE